MSTGPSDRQPFDLTRLGWGPPLLEVPARRWRGETESSSVEPVIEEIPIALVYNQLPHVVMMATPEDLEDFAIGFSLTEELVGTAAEVRGVEVVRYSRGIELQIQVDPDRMTVIESRNRRLVGRTGCGICGTDGIDAVLKTVRPVVGAGRVTRRAILRAIEGLAAAQPLNAAAGSVHAAGWATLDGEIALAREDVGRHNALDKLVGACARARVDPGTGFVVVTSRASFEMGQKAMTLGAGLLAAVSGPTGLAIRLADAAGLTLVGYARGGGMTVYTHPERIDPA